jgi:hypothetical protein
VTIERPRLRPIRRLGYDIPPAGHLRVIVGGGARVEQIPILRYMMVMVPGSRARAARASSQLAQKTAKRTQSHGAFSMTVRRETGKE